MGHALLRHAVQDWRKSAFQNIQLTRESCLIFQLTAYGGPGASGQPALLVVVEGSISEGGPVYSTILLLKAIIVRVLVLKFRLVTRLPVVSLFSF